MKVILNKPQYINIQEAIKVTQDMAGKVLIDNDEIKQELIKREDGRFVLRAYEKDFNGDYESKQYIDIFMDKVNDSNKNHILLKTPKGYMKPVNKVYEVDKQLERAIKHINEVK
jgi:ABC-type oligopeptide transport system ATPase subunit